MGRLGQEPDTRVGSERVGRQRRKIMKKERIKTTRTGKIRGLKRRTDLFGVPGALMEMKTSKAEERKRGVPLALHQLLIIGTVQMLVT